MFAFSSIEQYHAQLKEGSISCTDAVEYYLQQINRHKSLNAFTVVFAEEARQRAMTLDVERHRSASIGKLHGVVIGLKDLICYKDHPVSACSRMLQGFHSLYSATAVERLLNEGAIIIGMLNGDEFAMGSASEYSVYGPVRNPFDETRSAGGSSGGSAAAVSAGCCMVSLGSDTGGSVRQPADFCGVIGYKPAYGRVSRHGLIAYASSFDQIGIFGTNIPDIAAVLEVISGADSFDSSVGGLPPFSANALADETPSLQRFAWFPEALEHPSLDPEIADAHYRYIDRLKTMGHEVQPISFDLIDYIVPAYYVLTTAEASSNLSRYDGIRYGYRPGNQNSDLNGFYQTVRSEALGKEAKRRILLGSFVLSAGYQDEFFLRAQKVRRLLMEKTEQIFNEFSFILLPNSPVISFPAGMGKKDPITTYLADIYTVYANLTGIPAISLPLFKHSHNIPFGLQLLSQRHNELPLLRICNQLMQQLKVEN